MIRPHCKWLSDQVPFFSRFFFPISPREKDVASRDRHRPDLRRISPLGEVTLGAKN
jgi:hypothetical protein